MNSVTKTRSRIVVGFDQPESTRDALALAEMVANGSGTEVVIVGVVSSPLGSLMPKRVTSRIEAREFELGRQMQASAKGCDCYFEMVRSSSVARGLRDYVRKFGADLVVFGSSPRAAYGRTRAGRVASHLLQGAPCPVAVAPSGLAQRATGRLRVVGVGVDGSHESQEALRAAIELSDSNGSALRLISVAAQPVGVGWGLAAESVEEMARHNARVSLDRALEDTPEQLLPEAILRFGDPVSELINEASKGVDLVCLGSHSYGPMRRILLGSVVAELVHSAPFPVMVLPRGAHAAL